MIWLYGERVTLAKQGMLKIRWRAFFRRAPAAIPTEFALSL
jgi:hypothetical protein